MSLAGLRAMYRGLRKRVDSCNICSDGRKQYPVVLRKDIVEFIEEAHNLGYSSKRHLFKSLGITTKVYYCWLRDYREGLFQPKEALNVSRIPKAKEAKQVNSVEGGYDVNMLLKSISEVKGLIAESQREIEARKATINDLETILQALKTKLIEAI